MDSLVVLPSHVGGLCQVPSSKSHTLRALLMGAFAKGTSQIKSALLCDDSQRMINLCTLLGAVIEKSDPIIITGVGGCPTTPGNIIDVGNSGLVLRLGAALSCLCEGYTVFTGDESIRIRRPIQPLIDGIRSWSGEAISTQNNGHPPLIVKGPLKEGHAVICGRDSQPVSALLLAGSLTPGNKKLSVTNPQELPWIEMTLYWMHKLGLKIEHKNYEEYTITGDQRFSSFNFEVPGDYSSAAFPLAAALITKKRLTLQKLDETDCQGDKELFFELKKMGIKLCYDPYLHRYDLEKEQDIPGAFIDARKMIDAVPILAVLGCYAKGPWVIENVEGARCKESDRVMAIVTQLKKMGARIDYNQDKIEVFPSILHGASVHSWHDHRIAMSLAVAALGAKDITKISDFYCVNKTYPTFVKDFSDMGACFSYA